MAFSYLPLIVSTFGVPAHSGTAVAHAQGEGDTDINDTNPTGNQTNDTNPTGNPTNDTNPIGNPTNDTNPVGNCGPTQICNPLKYDTLCKLLEAILRIVTQIGAIIAVLLIIWSGFLFITAQGNPGKLKAAKNTLITTLVGTAVLLGASAIAQITIQTVLTITNQNNPGVCSI